MDDLGPIGEMLWWERLKEHFKARGDRAVVIQDDFDEPVKAYIDIPSILDLVCSQRRGEFSSVCLWSIAIAVNCVEIVWCPLSWIAEV